MNSVQYIFLCKERLASTLLFAKLNFDLGGGGGGEEGGQNFNGTLFTSGTRSTLTKLSNYSITAIFSSKFRRVFHRFCPFPYTLTDPKNLLISHEKLLCTMLYFPCCGRMAECKRG